MKQHEFDQAIEDLIEKARGSKITAEQIRDSLQAALDNVEDDEDDEEES